MNTEITDLENKIDELSIRFKNAEETLTTNKANSLRNELQKLIEQFDLLKKSLKKSICENLDESINEEVIESLISLIDDFITNEWIDGFSNATFDDRQIENVELSVDWNNNLSLEKASVEVFDYFTSSFCFDYEDFIKFIERMNSEQKSNLIKFISRELFELISEIIHKSIKDIETDITFENFNDFECELSYDKSIDVTEVIIDASQFINHFEKHFDFNRIDIENIIKNYHNFKSE
jgi:hypothetical protein